MRLEKLAVSLALLIAAASSCATIPALPQTSATPSVSLSITDWSPKFLALYEEAPKEKASPDARWELWKTMYHFAAVPPTPEKQTWRRRKTPSSRSVRAEARVQAPVSEM